MKLFFEDIYLFLTNRLFIASIVVCAMFYVLSARLFELQIINGEDYQFSIRETSTKSIVIKAPRGAIYDRLGRPLAVSESAFMLKLDPSARDMNEVILDLMELLDKNDETYIDNFPISKQEPYTFEFTGTGTREARWKKDMNIADETLSAADTFELLRDFFGVPEDMPNETARKILSVRSAMYLLRFRQYTLITVAMNIKPETIAKVEEENVKYRGFSVDVSSTRHYPGGEYVSHIIGYIGRINDEEMSRWKDLDYQPTDYVGKSGLELSFEQNLRGKDGTLRVEVDGLGRRLTALDVREPAAGDRLFLTFDLEFQKKVSEILCDMLKTILLARFTANEPKDLPISTTDLLCGVVMTGSLSVAGIWAAGDHLHQSLIKDYVLRVYPQADTADPKGVSEIKQVITDGIDKGAISSATMLVCMYEQGLITGDETYVAQIRDGYLRPYAAILEKIEADEITPQMVGLDPHSGAAVVVDVNSGGVLASVNYPTYDNNQFVNTFNNEYFQKINNDPTAPMFNRAFMERRAPGSTFKMITAVAGLESGVITPSTLIQDELMFSKAGQPFLRCWSSAGHGSLNVVQALTYSCNYFFCETAYRLGNARGGTTEEGIKILNDYMIAFGLNDATGVEIGEAFKYTRPGEFSISSPEYKEFLEKSYNPDAPKSRYEWYDGDTVATAIGQAMNNYTAANMAKYIAILASGGVRYQMRFVDRITDGLGALTEKREPVIEKILGLSPVTLSNVLTGMQRVVTIGTGLSVFVDFPIEIGGKTGTAEEDKRRSDHSSFGGFAPFDDPQIAVYVSLPFGNTPKVTYSAARVGRDIIGAYFGLDHEPERPERENILVK